MARQINRLTSRGVAALLERLNKGALRKDDFRRHADGGGLYLSVSRNGGCRWLFIYRWRDKMPEIGLGSARVVTLGNARIAAAKAREELAAGRNPKDLKPTDQLTFGAGARALIESMAPSWRNEKHRWQWHQTLLGESPPDEHGNVKKSHFDYCATIRDKPLSQLDVADAPRMLKPLWQTRSETASRLRGRCERVWDSAKAQGHCSGENPFRWRGNLIIRTLTKNEYQVAKHLQRHGLWLEHVTRLGTSWGADRWRPQYDAGPATLAGFGLDNLIASRLPSDWSGVLLALGLCLRAIGVDACLGLSPAPSPLGMAWLVFTVVAMGLLAVSKRTARKALGILVLRTESGFTLIDAALAAAVLAGVGLNALFGWGGGPTPWLGW